MAARRAIPKRLPKPAPPDAVMREYLRHLRKYADAYVHFMKAGLEGLLPMLRDVAAADTPEPQPISRTDAIRMDTNIEKRIRGLFDWVSAQLDRQFPDAVIGTWAKNMASHANTHAKKNVVKVAKMVDVEAEPLMRDGELSPYFRNVVEENVGLIRSIPTLELEAFKNKLVSAITKDTPQDQIREMIQANFDTTRSRAALIARDQTNKLNGRLNQYRQQQLGGKRYTWRGSKDSRERKDHLRLEGKVFSWSSPPVTNRTTGARNHPGQDFQCRCHAEMVLEDVVDGV